MATHPSHLSIAETKERLLFYTKAKQYQLQADRAYGWLFDEHGSLEDTFYLSTVTESDPELDRRIVDFDLQPVGQLPTTIPPSTRRATKRISKGKRRH